MHAVGRRRHSSESLSFYVAPDCTRLFSADDQRYSENMGRNRLFLALVAQHGTRLAEYHMATQEPLHFRIYVKLSAPSGDGRNATNICSIQHSSMGDITSKLVLRYQIKIK